MNITGITRLLASLALLLLLGGCTGTSAITGRFEMDLRPVDRRTAIYWPQEDEVPRYRYIGELIGEQNFVVEKDDNAAINFLKWVAGLFEEQPMVGLRRPTHGTVSASGRIYVVDPGWNGVFVFDPAIPDEKPVPEKPPEAAKVTGDEQAVKTVVKVVPQKMKGQLMLWDVAADGVNFKFPFAVAVVWQGNLAVSDGKLAIVAILDDKGNPVGKIGEKILKRPTGIAFDDKAGLLYVADTGAHDVKVFNSSGQLVSTIGLQGEDPGQFNAPTHLAFAYSEQGGQLYVSDSLNSRIQVFDEEGRFMRAFGERGINVGDLPRPKGVAASNEGIVYAIESYFAHMLVYNSFGELLMAVDGSGLDNGKFHLPSGIWLDNHGRVYLADMFNGRVVVYQFLGDDSD